MFHESGKLNRDSVSSLVKNYIVPLAFTFIWSLFPEWTWRITVRFVVGETILFCRLENSPPRPEASFLGLLLLLSMALRWFHRMIPLFRGQSSITFLSVCNAIPLCRVIRHVHRSQRLGRGYLGRLLFCLLHDPRHFLLSV